MQVRNKSGAPFYCSFLIELADYVLQRALTVAEGEQQEVLIGMVRPLLASMRQYSSAYTKHLTSSKWTISVILLQCSHICCQSKSC